MFAPETIPSEKRMNAMRCIIGLDPDLNFSSGNRGSRFQLRGKGQWNRFGGIKGRAGIEKKHKGRYGKQGSKKAGPGHALKLLLF
jgi:hypothetical protein